MLNFSIAKCRRVLDKPKLGARINNVYCICIVKEQSDDEQLLTV